MWCSRALNRTCGRLRAASRTPCTPIDTLVRPCVRGVAVCKMFLSVGRLPSTASEDKLPRSAASPVLCNRPTSRKRAYRTYGTQPSPTDPAQHPDRVSPGSPGSRAKSFHTCTGSQTARDLRRTRSYRSAKCCSAGETSAWALISAPPWPVTPPDPPRLPDSMAAHLLYLSFTLSPVCRRIAGPVAPRSSDFAAPSVAWYRIGNDRNRSTGKTARDGFALPRASTDSAGRLSRRP